MDAVSGKWNCRHCGRSNAFAIAPGEIGLCGHCNGESVVRADRVPDGRSSGLARAFSLLGPFGALAPGVVAKLRERYGEARDLVSKEQPYTQPYAHLDWILGPLRNHHEDEAAFDAGVSELVVLWLHDLARDLEAPIPGTDAADPAENAVFARDARRAVATRLRIATRDFAEAFAASRLEPAGSP